MRGTPIVALLAVLVLGGAWYAFVALSSDSADGAAPPAAQVTFTSNDEAVLANLACGGHASPGSGQQVTCKVCPEGSDFAGEGTASGWKDDGVLTGSFTAPGQDEALMHASGCESHANGEGGDFLFRRTRGSWNLVRYAQTAPAGRDCIKALWAEGRDAVICRVTDMHQGNASDAVQLMTFDSAAPSSSRNFDYQKANFVITYDNSSSCGSGSAPVAQLDAVDGVALVPTSNSRQSVSVKVTLARAPQVRGTEECPATKPERYTVIWKNLGDHFEAADGFVALAAKAEDRCCDLTVSQRVEPARY